MAARQVYAAWGEVRWSAGTLPTDFTFTGQREDRYIKLLDYGARWYNPRAARFISPDTIVPDFANPQSLNRFAYVGNNPLRYVDPSGHLRRGLTYPEHLGRRPTPTGGPHYAEPALYEASSLLEVLESEYGLAVSSEFTAEERGWLSNAYLQYAIFLGGTDAFARVIMQAGGLEEIVLNSETTVGLADPGGAMTLHDFGVRSGSPFYMYDEKGNREVAFTKLVWHETTHYLQFAIPESTALFVELTSDLGWVADGGRMVMSEEVAWSQREEDYEVMADVFAYTLYDQTAALVSQYGATRGYTLPGIRSPLLQLIEQRFGGH